jgi:LmbE family N-acetylglucosaminyl deacetylase
MTDVVVLYATPHQDDEMLFGCASMRTMLRAGHRVRVLLCTTGQNSGIRPATGLSIQDFVAARDDEYRRACRRVGVRFEDILFGEDLGETRTEDGQLTVPAAEAMLRAALADCAAPGVDVWVKTYSHLQPSGETQRHLDHLHLGQAAVNLLQAGEIMPNGLRGYAEPWLLDPGQTIWAGRKLMTETVPASDAALVRAALDEYKITDPFGFKIGVGYQSVNEAFDLVRTQLVSHYHVP